MPFTQVGNHHHCLLAELSYHPPPKKKRNPVPIGVITPRLQATNLISVSIDLPILDISCKGNRTSYVVLCDWLLLSIICLGSVHVMACVSTDVFLLLNTVRCLHPCISHFVYPFIGGGTFGLFALFSSWE